MVDLIWKNNLVAKKDTLKITSMGCLKFSRAALFLKGLLSDLMAKRTQNTQLFSISLASSG